MKQIYRVTVSGDCEGRSSKTVGYFVSELVASCVARAGIGSMAMGPEVGTVQAIDVYESIVEFAATISDAELKHLEGRGLSLAERKVILCERALKKLTKEECEALHSTWTK